MNNSNTIHLPDQILKIWKELDYEVTLAHQQWALFRSIFGTNEERIDLINSVSGTSFVTFHKCMLNDMELSLCKLSDPARTGKWENMTIRQLHQKIHAWKEEDICESLNGSIEMFEDSVARIRERRNKIIAHADFEASMDLTKDSLANPSRREIEKCLHQLREVMWKIAERLILSKTQYQAGIYSHEGEKLLFAFVKAKKYDELVSSGEIPQIDRRELWKRLG